MSTKPPEEESGPQSPVPDLRSFNDLQLGDDPVLQAVAVDFYNSTQESDQRPTKQIITQESEDQENVQAKEKLAIDGSMSHQETNSDTSSALVYRVGLPPEPRRSRPSKLEKIRKDQPKNPQVIVYNKECEELDQLHEDLVDKHKELKKANQAKNLIEELVKNINDLRRKLKEKNERVDELERELIKLNDQVESMGNTLKELQLSKDPIFPDDDIIGEGSTDGTIVYKTKEQGVDVAVKRMILGRFGEERKKKYEKESRLLKLSQDECDNVVKYYRDYTTDHFFYLVMEYCDFTLYDHIVKPEENHAIETKVDWLRQAMNGVQHIHSKGIAHRDLKPHNILLRKQSNGSFKVKISDFGLSKQYRPNQTTSTARSKGTRGWAAPELHDAKKKKKGDDGRTGDIFTMGCVVYFVLTGSHLFDEDEDEDDRQRKIQMNEVPPMEQLASVPGCAVAEDLIRKMITFDPKPDQPLYSRLSTEEVRCHCFFLSEGMQCHFFEEVNDYLKEERPWTEEVSILSEELDKDPGVVDNDWTKHLLPIAGAEQKKYSGGKSVRRLIRYIRNKLAHPDEVVEHIEKELDLQRSCFPKHTIVKYFTTKFPKLLLHVYTVMKECDEEVIKKYYSGNLICCMCMQE